MIIATLDIETDPFKYGRTPKPFCCEFFDGHTKKQWWGENCLQEFVEWLKEQNEHYKIYAHNGGKFDFWFLLYLQFLSNPMRIINGRIVEAHLAGHVLRDSLAIIPVSLAKYEKTKIDYNKFEVENREKHKKEILDYLHDDCRFLHELVLEFNERFGDKLTIGGTAIKELQKHHDIIKTGESHDTKFRPFYFGGRVQAFKSGLIKKDLKYFDVNSMYPHVMATKYHPSGKAYLRIDTQFDDYFTKDGFYKENKLAPYFIHFRGSNNGALPTRIKNKGLSFNEEYGEFYATGHEIQVALKHNLIEIDEIIDGHICMDYQNFNDFVQTFSAEKIEAKLNGDKIKELFSKLILNSSYGKFGQNPENFYDYELIYMDEMPLPEPWELYIDGMGYEIWRKPALSHLYYDVAVAASITGAARAVLLDGLIKAKNPVYCDTDSIICEDLPGVILDQAKLGAWDIEATGTQFACGGKKLYALFDEKGECVKMASKGARLVPNDIKEIAKGKVINWQNDAPCFKLTGQVQFIERNIKQRSN